LHNAASRRRLTTPLQRRNCNKQRNSSRAGYIFGFEVSRLIKQQQPEIPILFFSIYDTDDILEEARRMGDGFVLKEKIVEMLPNAIKALLQKQAFFPSNNRTEAST
jgi:DNA-binding NarL/FixJ family response regulator